MQKLCRRVFAVCSMAVVGAVAAGLPAGSADTDGFKMAFGASAPAPPSS